jgi:ABC-type cobalamin/Fe3+-siderophores transport system ATPase subunit
LSHLNAFEIDNIEVRAGRRTILQIEKLIAPGNSFTTILGPNGAGKSTLLRVCMGMLKPRTGTMAVLNQPVTVLRGRRLCAFRRTIGYVPQAVGVHSEMPLTLREVVAIGRTGMAGLFRRLQPDDWRQVDRWIEKLGLTHVKHQPYSELSGGEQRKAAIARALVQEPRMLMLDEPTANLDLGWREQIIGILEQLHRDLDLAILLVCHELEVIPPACEAIAVLQHGRLLASGPVEEVLTDDLVASLYGPGMQVERRNRRYQLVVPPVSLC